SRGLRNVRIRAGAPNPAQRRDSRVGRAGIEPATLGLKVPGNCYFLLPFFTYRTGLHGSFWRFLTDPAAHRVTMSWCVHGAFRDTLGRMRCDRALRRLRPGDELLRRRAAGEPLRSLATDYGVAHTTLSRYFAREEVRRQLGEVERAIRTEEGTAKAQRTAERRIERAVRRRAKEEADRARSSRVNSLGRRRGSRSPYAAWLDEHDSRRPLLSGDLRSRSDDLAEQAVEAGG